MERYSRIIIQERKRQHKSSKFNFIYLILLIGIGVAFYSIFFNKDASQLLSTSVNSENVLEQKSQLETVVQKELEGAKGDYAVAVKNLKTNESYYFNEHRSYDSGSLYKLWVMAAVFKQIEAGTLKEDQQLSADIASLNRIFGIPDESAELTTGVVNFTISSATRQMITISHNYAALALTQKVKLSSVAQFLKENSFNESKIGVDNESPVTTASDMAIFFERLYRGEFGNPDSNAKMIDLLREQKLNGKLPKYLPEGTLIAHKTGEIGYMTHDAGIVYSPQSEYIIVVLSESESPAGAEERIANISKAVYNYFQQQSINVP